MALIDFPPSLPAAANGTLVEGLQETKVSDQGEVGSARQRNRFTRALERFSYSLTLSEAQKDLLIAFYMDDLGRGVEAFNWTHPTSAVVYEATMPMRPKASHMTAGAWSVAIRIEQI